MTPRRINNLIRKFDFVTWDITTIITNNKYYDSTVWSIRGMFGNLPVTWFSPTPGGGEPKMVLGHHHNRKHKQLAFTKASFTRAELIKKWLIEHRDLMMIEISELPINTGYETLIQFRSEIKDRQLEPMLLDCDYRLLRAYINTFGTTDCLKHLNDLKAKIIEYERDKLAMS